MTQLTEQEFGYLKSQIVISSWSGLRRGYPYAFTGQEVAEGNLVILLLGTRALRRMRGSKNWKVSLDARSGRSIRYYS